MMIKRRYYIIFAALALFIIVLCCFLFIISRAGKEFTVSLYYRNLTGNNLDMETRIIPHTDKTTDAELFEAVISELQVGPKVSQTLSNTFDGTEILTSNIDEEEKTAYIELSDNFWNKSPVDRLFIKSSVVYTLTALSFIDDVNISAGGIKISDVPLNRKNMLLNPDIASEKINYQTITLYFADSSMSYLQPEQRLMEVKQSQDLEYQLIELLLNGPESADLVSPIPAGTKLINTTTENGICYVNLSSAFLNSTNGGLNALQVYSVVNSLTGLDSVNSVQLYIEGQKVTDAAGSVDISAELSRDESLIKTPQ